MADEAPRAYSYIRFSSVGQARGDSLRRQLELSKAYAEKHNLVLDAALSFKDLGVSAFTGSNLSAAGQLKAFIDAVDRGLVPSGSYLLVESLDRLTRAHIHDAVRLLLEILGKGIIVVTLGDEVVYRGKSDDASRDLTQLLISITILARAHEESLTKSRRVGAAWSNKRKNADKQKLTKQCPAWLELSPDRSEYRLLDEKVAVVRQIIEMIQSGLGKALVAKRLNQAEIPSIAADVRLTPNSDGLPPDRGWYSSYVTKIVKSRALIGEFQPHRMVDGRRVPAGEPIADYFPRVISDEEFALLQHLISERGRRSGGARGSQFSNLFTGLARCGYCGSPMVYVDKGQDQRRKSSRTNRFLVCHRAKRGDGCHYVSWTYDDLEDGFFRFVNVAEFEEFAQTGRRSKDERQLLSERRVIDAAEANRLRDRTERLSEAIASGAERLSSVIDLLAKTERDLAACIARIATNDAASEALAMTEAQAQASAKALREVGEALRSVEDEERFRLRARVNAHLRTTLSKLLLFPGGWIHSEEERAPIRAEMIASAEYPADVVEMLIDEAMSAMPKKHERFVLVRNRWSAERFYRLDGPVAFNLDAAAEFPNLQAFAHRSRQAAIKRAFGVGENPAVSPSSPPSPPLRPRGGARG